MSLPDRVHFRITTSLFAEAVLQHLRDCTLVPRARNHGKKNCLGFEAIVEIEKEELTQLLQRQLSGRSSDSAGQYSDI